MSIGFQNCLRNRRLQTIVSIWIHIRARQHSSSRSLSDAGLVECHQYRLHREGWTTTKITRPQPTWLSCAECNVEAFHRLHWKLKTIPELKVHCSRSGMTCCRQRLTTKFRKHLNASVSAGGEHLEHRYELYRNILTELRLLFHRLY